MPEYSVDLTITVTADNKSDALEVIKHKFDELNVEVTEDMERELFAELGVDWEV